MQNVIYNSLIYNFSHHEQTDTRSVMDLKGIPISISLLLFITLVSKNTLLLLPSSLTRVINRFSVMIPGKISPVTCRLSRVEGSITFHLPDLREEKDREIEEREEGRLIFKWPVHFFTISRFEEFLISISTFSEE